MLDIAPIRARLGAAREIAASIPYLTSAGQNYAMNRIMALLSDDVQHHLHDRLGDRHARLAAFTARLAFEAARPVPNVDAFHVGIEALLDILLLAVKEDDELPAATPPEIRAAGS